MPQALIGLGSNLGDRAATLSAVLDALTLVSGIEVLSRSRWFETPPVGGPAGQPAYLNGAVVVETSLAPEALFYQLQRLEAAHGRQRTERWAARTLDLDLLLYDDLVLD